MKKRHSLLRYVITFIVIGCLAASMLWYVGSRKPTIYQSPTANVQVQAPLQGDFAMTLKLGGYIDTTAKVPVVPFVSGTVISYFFSAGDQVSKGDLMAVIDPTPYRLQVQQAEAAYLVAEATASRLQGLYDAKAASLQSLEQAKAQRDACKAQLELANVQLEYCQVKAPVDGTVLMATSAQGSAASPQNPIYVLGNLESLIMRLNVPEAYYKLVKDNEAGLQAVASHGDVFRLQS